MLTKQRIKVELYVREIGNRFEHFISIFFLPIAFIQTIIKLVNCFTTNNNHQQSINPTEEETNKTVCFSCRITSKIDLISKNLNSIPDRAFYLADRYLFHSPFCLLNKVGYKKSQYILDGIYLSRNEGYNDYLLKEANISKTAKDNIKNNNSINNMNHVRELEAPKDKSLLNTFSQQESKSQESSTTNPLQKVTSMEIKRPNSSPTGTKGNTKTKLSFSIPANSNKVILQLKGNRSNHFQTVTSSISPHDTEYVARVSEAIRKVFSIENYDDGSLAPIILRLSWHCCATYNKYTGIGGSNGSTMRFVPEITDEGNTGLDIARGALEPIKQLFPKISYSDLWTLAGKIAVEEMGGPTTIDWKPGRVDCRDKEFVPPNGYLPFADKDVNHIRTAFERMGMNDKETVALLGAHCLGRCHKRFSGWEGKWTPHPISFTNEFFIVLLNEKWTLGTVPETGRQQFYNEDRSLIMLNTDMELLNDENYLRWVKIFAEDKDIYFRDFSEAFGKLLELGIERDSNGMVLPKKRY
ncbi:CCP2 [[Candida] subhashii]|uniref:Peroxidase n=1 Tax=[Candida] subhashii TaxID=561895 RepID=A0A8J5UE75_9ASCO|nr:CCP2 [[Candida] subhashii]KAG7660888.1 CCP2 [[Candida] subhashii]